jgi:hypothetical protein
LQAKQLAVSIFVSHGEDSVSFDGQAGKPDTYFTAFPEQLWAGGGPALQ